MIVEVRNGISSNYFKMTLTRHLSLGKKQELKSYNEFEIKVWIIFKNFAFVYKFSLVSVMGYSEYKV